MAELAEILNNLQSHDPHVRAVAAFDLGQSGLTEPEQVLPFLTVALADSHELVRAFAAQAVGDMGVHGRPCLETLEALSSRDESARVRTAAAQAARRVLSALAGGGFEV